MRPARSITMTPSVAVSRISASSSLRASAAASAATSDSSSSASSARLGEMVSISAVISPQVTALSRASTGVGSPSARRTVSAPPPIAVPLAQPSAPSGKIASTPPASRKAGSDS